MTSRSDRHVANETAIQREPDLALYRNIGRTDIYLDGVFIAPGEVFELPTYVAPGENLEPVEHAPLEDSSGPKSKAGPSEPGSPGGGDALEFAVPSADAADLATWLLALCRAQATHRQPRRVIQNRGPSWCRSGPRLKAALDELEAAGQITRCTEGRQRLIVLKSPGLASMSSEPSQLSQEEG